MDRMLIWFGVGLVILGLLTIGMGALLGALGGREGRLLPGDIVISRPGFTLIFPIATSLVLSVLLTVLLWAIAAWRR